MSFTPSPKSELAIERDQQKARSILALGRACNAEQVRSQFKLIAKANHPDHGGCGAGAYTMELLQWAKDILLKDLEKKDEKNN